MRLVMMVASLVAAGTIFTFGDVVSTHDVRGVVADLGPAAPIVFVVVGAVLATVLVPGPVLAAASGLLFGVVLGTLVTVASSAGSAFLAQRLGRAAGLDGARAILGPVRAAVTEDLLARRGLLAVVGQRLLPGVPDAPATYAFGALGASARQVVLGTLIGASPRAFAYTALGASIDDPSSPLALAGIAVWVVVSVAGVELARRWWSARRRAARQLLR